MGNQITYLCDLNGPIENLIRGDIFTLPLAGGRKDIKYILNFPGSTPLFSLLLPCHQSKVDLNVPLGIGDDPQTISCDLKFLRCVTSNSLGELRHYQIAADPGRETFFDWQQIRVDEAHNNTVIRIINFVEFTVLPWLWKRVEIEIKGQTEYIFVPPRPCC